MTFISSSVHATLQRHVLPAMRMEQPRLVGAFSSGGNSPVLATYMKRKMSDTLTPRMGELNEILGKWRPELINRFPDENERKAVFERIIDHVIKEERIPYDAELEEIIGRK